MSLCYDSEIHDCITIIKCDNFNYWAHLFGDKVEMNVINICLILGIGLMTMMIPISLLTQYGEASKAEVVTGNWTTAILPEDEFNACVDNANSFNAEMVDRAGDGYARFQNGTEMTCEQLEEVAANELTSGQELTSTSTFDEFNMSELTSGQELTNGSLMNSDDQGAPLVMICLEPGLANTDPDDKWKCRFYVFDDIDLSSIDLQNDFKEEYTFNLGE